MKFDDKGNLFPYRPYSMTTDAFESAFGFDESRKFLLSKLFHFVAHLKNIIPDQTRLWINGSFVTLQNDPQDIDVVVFINFQYFRSKENQLTALKENQEFVDLYYVKVFPEDHRDYQLAKLDELDWLHFFTTDRKNNRKGFVELIF